MNVGIVSTWFERGAGIVSRQISDAVGLHHKVFIYARGEKYAVGDPIWDGPNVHWGKRLHWTGSGKIDKGDFVNWLAANNIDLVIFNEQRWWQPVIWAKAKNVKVAAYIDYYTPDSVPCFAIYDLLICNTKRHYSVFQNFGNAVYIPWGTDVDLYKPNNDRKPKSKIVFFHSCGWDWYRKGTDLLIKAFAAMERNENVKLIIHAQCDISDILPKLSDMDIEVIRKTVSAPGCYNLGDFYIYPSRLEGIGLTICEALSSGLPVITTDEQPMSEFVVDGVDGFVCDVESRFKREDGYYWNLAECNVAHLTNILMRLSQLDSQSINEMQQNARESAVTKFNWSVNSVNISLVLESIKSRPLSRDELFYIYKFDYLHLKGLLDFLMWIPFVKTIFSNIVKIYRIKQSPHLYT